MVVAHKLSVVLLVVGRQLVTHKLVDHIEVIRHIQKVVLMVDTLVVVNFVDIADLDFAC